MLLSFSFVWLIELYLYIIQYLLTMKTYSLLAGILLSFSLSVQAGDLKLWYKQPAGTWVEALPVGNSRMGAMVYGGTAREELQLNDETMWGAVPTGMTSRKHWKVCLKCVN